MAFIIGTTLALVFLEGFWRFAAIAAVAGIELAEIFVWLRWRKVRSTTGAEGLVGMKGRALTDCRPEGQVSVKGQIWKATATTGVSAGEDIVVRAVHGLQLTVAKP